MTYAHGLMLALDMNLKTDPNRVGRSVTGQVGSVKWLVQFSFNGLL